MSFAAFPEGHFSKEWMAAEIHLARAKRPRRKLLVTKGGRLFRPQMHGPHEPDAGTAPIQSQFPWSHYFGEDAP
jgi:hypothetical protein